MKKDLKISKDTCVHCPTEELANKVLKIAHKLKYKWANGGSYEEHNRWLDYKHDTCYQLRSGTFGDLPYFKYNRNEIISAEEFIKLYYNRCPRRICHR